MCALITAIDMNLTDRVKALCDEFLENNEIQVFVCAKALWCSYKYKQHYAFNMFYHQLQLEYFLVCNKLQIQIALCFQYVLSPITTGILFGLSSTTNTNSIMLSIFGITNYHWISFLVCSKLTTYSHLYTLN